MSLACGKEAGMFTILLVEDYEIVQYQIQELLNAKISFMQFLRA